MANERSAKESDQLAKKIADELTALKGKLLKFSGEVMTFVYRPYMGFADYAIVRMKLKDGIIESVEEISDPLASFEARAHMETKQAYQLEKMKRSYPGGFQHV